LEPCVSYASITLVKETMFYRSRLAVQ